MSDPTLLQRTPLYTAHQRAGAKLVEFGGWEMPVYYTSILDEHRAVRQAAGLFDISHMGQIFVSGAGAEHFLNQLLTNNLAKLAVGQGQYTLMLNPQGGVIDDLIAYRTGEREYFLVVNASTIAEDFAWLTEHLSGEVTVENRSDAYAGLAVQGPQAVALLNAFVGAEIPPRNQIGTFSRGDAALLVARTGYTGEDGAEVFMAASAALKIWDDLLELGQSFGLQPCGLGARDSLRLEMCYPLNHSDLTSTHTPLEAGLGFFVDLGKENFMGKSALDQQKAAGLTRKLMPFRMTAKSPPPRAHYPIVMADAVVGETCSGGLSPCLETGIGMAYLPIELAKPGTSIEIDIRGRRFPAVLEKKPLYKKS